MIRILEIRETPEVVKIRGTVDGENKSGDSWVIPESPLVPSRVWGSKIINPIFEYDIQKNN